MKKKISTITQEKGVLEDLLQDKSDEVSRYQGRFMDMESEIITLKLKLASLDSIEEDMIAEMRNSVKIISSILNHPVGGSNVSSPYDREMFSTPGGLVSTSYNSSLFPQYVNVDNMLMSTSSDKSAMDGNESKVLFGRGKKVLLDLVSKVSHVCTQQKIYIDSLEKAKRESLDYKSRYEQTLNKCEDLEVIYHCNNLIICSVTGSGWFG